MKRLMKARKNIAGMKFSISSGALVYATDDSGTYSISTLGKEDLTLSGIPAHYLEEVGPGERAGTSPDRRQQNDNENCH